jgi:SulP family sulfate permease
MSALPGSAPVPATPAGEPRRRPIVVPSRLRAPFPRLVQSLPKPREATVELVAGLVTALALIPETISFSVVAGVDPAVGLFTSFIICTVIAFTGGRPAMISAAAGSMALVAAPLVREHGFQYLLATTVCVGALMFLLGLAGVAKLIRFVPRTVVIGFVNALAILIFTAQMPHVFGHSWRVYPLVAAGLFVLVTLPRLTKAVPAPLVAVAVLTVAAETFRLKVPTVGDEGRLPTGLPRPTLPHVPMDWTTVRIVAPYALALTAVGLLETLLTAQIIDRMTGSGHNANREAWGLGVANLASGFLGGMGGCAMIGQAILNVSTGGRRRLSTFAAGGFLLLLVLPLHTIVQRIPMSALAAVMIVVAVMTFDWDSVRPATLRRLPISETFVMVATVAVVVPTNDLAYGVGVGVILSALLFTRKAAHLAHVTSVLDPDGGERIYAVQGPLFFASTGELVTAFDYCNDPARVVIDLSDAVVLDSAAAAALDDVVHRYEERGRVAELAGMDHASAAMLRSVHPALPESQPE